MAKSASDLEREIRAALGKCALSARGLWHEMRYLIETESDRPGHLQRNGRPISDQQLALAAGCSSKKVARLLQALVDVGLVERSRGCWISGRLAAMHTRRERRRILTQDWRQRGGVSRDTHCDRAVIAAQSRHPPPPSSSLPHTPSLTPPSDPLFGAGAPSASVPVAGNGDGEQRRRERVLTAEQHAARVEFSDWYRCCAWPRGHGGAEYGFEQVDAVKVLECLRHPQVKWNLEKLKALAQLYLDEPEIYGIHGHPLTKFRQRLNYLAGVLARRQQEGATRVLRAADSKPFAGARRALPNLLAGGGRAAAG